jgi:Phospholipase_D-nuclease N-terminal
MIATMVRVYVFLFAAALLLTMLALISCLSADDGQVRALPRLVWLPLILIFPVFGPIMYFATGRPLPTAPRPSLWPFPGAAAATGRGPAPEDDPEFLRALELRRRNDPGHTTGEQGNRNRSPNSRRNPPGETRPGDPEPPPTGS